MKAEKMICKFLKWIFSFFVGMMGVATASVLVMLTVFRLPAVIAAVQALHVNELPFGRNTLTILTSPLFGMLLIGNFVLYGTLFYLVRSFFQNIETGRVFIQENIQTGKGIVLLLVVLATTSSLPNLYMAAQGLQTDTFYLHLGYSMTAAIIWIFVKILEQASMQREDQLLF